MNAVINQLLLLRETERILVYETDKAMLPYAFIEKEGSMYKVVDGRNIYLTKSAHKAYHRIIDMIFFPEILEFQLLNLMTNEKREIVNNA